MFEIEKKYLIEFVNAAHKVGNYGLVKCSSGNLSLRVDNDIVLLSKSGSWLSELCEDDISICRIGRGELLNDKKPTMENVFHRGILAARPEINVVLHFQSPHATTFACSDISVQNYNVIAEVPIYIGEIAVVPFITPGSEELADAVVEAAKNHNMVMMKNHGMVTVGKDFNDAIQKAIFFELACEIILKSTREIRYLSDSDIKSLDKYISGR